MPQIEYLDPSIAGEGFNAETHKPGAWMDAPDSSGEEWQPDIDPPHVNDYAAFKKHKHYRQYFRPYRYVPFPAWMYHATLGEKIVKTKEEAEALGSSWSRTPIVRKVDMTGKSLPVKSETQRLAEVIATAMPARQTAAIDATTIAGIVAAVIAALPQQTKAVVDPEPAQVVPLGVQEAIEVDETIERAALLELGEKEGVKLDGRWSTQRMKEALGL